MKAYFKTDIMIQLNYSHLDADTQNQLLAQSKQDVKKWYGVELEFYALKNDLDYNSLLEEEAFRNLYSYSYSFNIWNLHYQNNIEKDGQKPFFLLLGLVNDWGKPLQTPQNTLPNCLKNQEYTILPK